jgi:hypothetical protein
VTLTAYDIDDHRVVFMTNTAGEAEDYVVWEAARATSATPTFFAPAKVRALRDGQAIERTLVDGGVYASDPVFAAYAEARKNGFAADEIHILSLGTGHTTRSYRYDEARRWGLADWLRPSDATPIISIMMHGQASSASYLARRLLDGDEPDPQRYARIDVPLAIPKEDASGEFGRHGLPAPRDDLDDASEENVRALAAVAHHSLTTPHGQKAFEQAVGWLEQRYSVFSDDIA